MERKKITFDSFIRAVILGAIIIGVLMLLKRIASVLPCLAYCLSDIPISKLLPA